MTGETKEQTDPWIEKHGAAYGYAYLAKDELSGFMKSLDMGGYPSAALVNPKGKVVWVGHPSSANGNLIEKHLKGADRTPVEVAAVTKRWPKEARSAKSAFAKGQLAKALAAAQKLGQEHEAVAKDIQRIIKRRVETLDAKHKEGDFLGFMDGAGDLAKGLKGLPEGDHLAALIKSTRSDKKAKAVMKAQKTIAKIAKMLPEMSKERDIKAVLKKLESITVKHEDSYADVQASKLIEKIKGGMGAH